MQIIEPTWLRHNNSHSLFFKFSRMLTKKYSSLSLNFCLYIHKIAGESEVSQALKRSVRVLCWIMTSLNNTESRAVHVNATWAPRCNKYVFITSKPVSKCAPQSSF